MEVLAPSNDPDRPREVVRALTAKCPGAKSALHAMHAGMVAAAKCASGEQWYTV